MKSNLHPKWNHQAKVTCGCGNVFYTGSQLDEITVDICSACHPFYTGEMKFVDRQGRVDRFMQKVTVAQQKKAAQQAKAAEEKVQDTVEETPSEALSYKQLLQKEQNRLKTAKQAA